MQKSLTVAALIAGVLLCVLIAVLVRGPREEEAAAAPEDDGLGQVVADLEQQVQAVTSERDSLQEERAALQQQIAGLTEDKQADREVIANLWSLLVADTRRQSQPDAAAEAEPPAKSKENPPDQAPASDKQYDYETVKNMIDVAGGDLEAAVRQIVTSEGLDAFLQAHGEQPACWVAAASLMPDREAALKYLEEAAALHPDSPAVLSALVQAQIRAGQIDESTLAYAGELENVDPTNLLGDCYSAYCQFESGDVAAALEALSAAGAKGRFADNRIDALMARYDYLLAEGCADPVALGLSAFTLPLDHLGMLRQIEQQSITQVQSLSAAGRLDEALKIAQDVSNVGRTVSASGRFLLHDRVGIAMQQAGLAEQRGIYEALGDLQQIQEIDSRLQAIQQRSATIDTMIQGFGQVMANMTEQDFADYVEGTILNGEFATLQSIPEIAAALEPIQ
ncbi:MAG: hypothetical protein JW741_17670 [Sedimentisphaerales bacterium]|nr:hypothetical protein [Sedimentisphaerales bacterium]